MFRLCHFIRRRAPLSLADFRDHWLSVHGPLVLHHAAALGVRRYVQTHIHHDDPLAHFMRGHYGTSADFYDGVEELWFSDREALAAALASSAGSEAAAGMLQSERAFIEGSRSVSWFGVELPQLEAAEPVVAHERSAVVKWVAVLWKPPGLGLEAGRAHWLMNHGPVVREGARAVPMLRYLQVHRFADPLADRLRTERDEEDEDVYGHAELWLDRRALAAASGGPEFEQAFDLFREDGRLFIDLPRSLFMIGKEHVLLDRARVERPLPRPPAEGLWPGRS